jgi:Reverse transcriptase (RNA-dependent DNA polymerase)
MVQTPHTSGQFRCWVWFSNCLNDWFFIESNRWSAKLHRTKVLGLTSHIEIWFPTQTENRSSIVFIDLTAAYDTVCRTGLMQVVPCARISTLMKNMLSNRFFQVYMGDKSSRWHRLNDGLPQGSVLAPVLFNLYLTDIPETLETVSVCRWHCADLPSKFIFWVWNKPWSWPRKVEWVFSSLETSAESS